MVATWLFTVGVGIYGFWRYVYKPWQIMRLDIKALADKLAGLEAEQGLRKALTRDDTEQAILEQREMVRRAYR